MVTESIVYEQWSRLQGFIDDELEEHFHVDGNQEDQEISFDDSDDVSDDDSYSDFD